MRTGETQDAFAIRSAACQREANDAQLLAELEAGQISQQDAAAAGSGSDFWNNLLQGWITIEQTRLMQGTIPAGGAPPPPPPSAPTILGVSAATAGIGALILFLILRRKRA